MKSYRCYIAAATLALLAVPTTRADLIVKKDGSVMEGNILARDSHGLSVKTDEGKPAIQVPADVVSRVIVIDDKGAETAEAGGMAAPAKRPDAKWQVPKEPAGPPIPVGLHGNTYYVIPLHGVVGETYVDYALDKSLADAVKRKPTVVVLDIDSPGGKVAEAEDMMKTLHRYNKDLRIVALADENLSASAITSLSVHEIYMKPTGTIGAATSFDPQHLDLPPNIEEKMQSAWRAVARNSAEEGGHEPLLAEAMIDSSRELHLETVDGKKVVKEGPGDHILCQKGKILTLTSHEAVDCGLAAGVAEDFSDLGKQLKMPNWKECPGLGTVLAAYLPDRWRAMQNQEKQIEVSARAHLAEAKENIPSDQITLERVITGPAGPIMPGNPTPGRFGPTAPGGPARPGFGGGGFDGGFGGRASPSQNPRVVEQVAVDSPEARAKWLEKSLATVVALQKVEGDLQDSLTLEEAFGDTNTDDIQDAAGAIAATRAEIYANRNRFSAPSGIAHTPVAPPPLVRLSEPKEVPSTPAPETDGLPTSARKTELLGGMGGSPFIRVDDQGRPMIGVRYTLGKWQGKPVIRRIEPLFEKPADAQNSGTTLLAKDGYAVGGLVVDASVNVDSFKVQFFRIKDGKPDPSDQYSSDWQGAPGDHALTHKLGGNGDKVLGIYGRQGLNQDAVGLVTVAAP